MNLAIIGINGLVGSKLIELLIERKIPYQELYLVSNRKNQSENISLRGKSYKVLDMNQVLEKEIDVAIFATSNEITLAWIDQFVKKGICIIDNSSAFRMTHNLIIPEVNNHLITKEDKIIANPNCVVTQLVLAIAPLHKEYIIKKLVLSTYQAVTGSGRDGVKQLITERNQLQGNPPRAEKHYPRAIDNNLIPQIDNFTGDDTTKEEQKIKEETQKILNQKEIEIDVTAVRVPIMSGHAIAVHLICKQKIDLKKIQELLKQQEGVIVQENNQGYITPLEAQNTDQVFVSRVRKAHNNPYGLNLWIVSDNLRKGAATNNLQILEKLIKMKRF